MSEPIPPADMRSDAPADARSDAPDGTLVPDAIPPRPPRSRVGVVVQVVGFLVGLGLLGWCVTQAFKPQNRASLERLAEAPAVDVALILALTGASLVLNGLMFWALLRPVKRIAALDCVAVNAVATFLNYLPFKLSLVFRFLVHNRRNGVPLLTIGAWIGAFAVVMLCVLGPLLAAGVHDAQLGPDERPPAGAIDPVYWLLTLAAPLALLAVAVLGARTFAGPRGLARLDALTRPLPLGVLNRLVKSRFFAQLHAGFDMLGAPGPVGAAFVLRAFDTLAQAARFLMCARVVGADVSWQQAMLFASAYYLIGAASPAGALGTREAGTVGLGAAIGLKITAIAGAGAAAGAAGVEGAGDPLTVIVLLILATEAVVNLAGAVLGIAWLRPDRLLKTRRRASGIGHRGGEMEAAAQPPSASSPGA